MSHPSLQRDSDDITNSLNVFFSQRQAAVDAQQRAMEDYELELFRIGNVEEE